MERRRPRPRKNRVAEVKPKKRVRPAKKPAAPKAPSVRNDPMLQHLTPTQIRFVTARLMAKSDCEAAEMIGIHVSTCRGWKNKDRVDLAVQMYQQDTVDAARLILRASAAEAAGALVSGLTGSILPQQVAAARAVLDRAGLPGVQKREFSGGLDVTGLTGLTDAELEAIASGRGSGTAEQTTG